jgi:hypothetical protein
LLRPRRGGRKIINNFHKQEKQFPPFVEFVKKTVHQ